MTRVLMVGSAEQSGGGVASVLRLMKTMPFWEKYHCGWLGTQIQRGYGVKLWYALKAYFRISEINPQLAKLKELLDKLFNGKGICRNLMENCWLSGDSYPAEIPLKCIKPPIATVPIIMLEVGKSRYKGNP